MNHAHNKGIDIRLTQEDVFLKLKKIVANRSDDLKRFFAKKANNNTNITVTMNDIENRSKWIRMETSFQVNYQGIFKNVAALRSFQDWDGFVAVSENESK